MVGQLEEIDDPFALFSHHATQDVSSDSEESDGDGERSKTIIKN